QRLKRRTIQSDPDYAAMIKNMDENLGRMIQSLKDQGIYEDTMINFTSDNSVLSTAEFSPTCNAPLHEGKGWMYDGGTREPLVISLPGVTKPGSVCDHVTTTPDLYPTILEALGLPLQPKQHCDGKSILPLLRG